jgi:xanthine dehydrogenase accessory factor
MRTSDWNRPETDVFDQISTALDEDSPAVLATVVSVEGSAYRRPGAKMLLRPDGDGVGSITAGCLEDEVRALADDVLADGDPRVETWDLTGDNDVWGFGVGCNGVITVLLEPLGDSYREVADSRLSGDPIGVATVVGGENDADVGDRAYYRPGEGFAGGDVPEAVLDAVASRMADLVDGGNGETVVVDADGGSYEVFLDGVRPSPKLVVFGSGHDVEPVVELSKLSDFRVTVVSFRGGRADPEQFPRADEVVSASPREVPEVVEWDENTHAVVMSHNFVDDRLTLEQLLETPVPYVGLMGPRKRFEDVREALADDGRTLTDDERERIYTPVGLNLGADTPHQIALSIVSEVLAVAHDRQPRHLTQHEGPIHDRADVKPE